MNVLQHWFSKKSSPQNFALSKKRAQELRASEISLPNFYSPRYFWDDSSAAGSCVRQEAVLKELKFYSNPVHLQQERPSLKLAKTHRKSSKS